jgi:hypothetical protein
MTIFGDATESMLAIEKPELSHVKLPVEAVKEYLEKNKAEPGTVIHVAQINPELRVKFTLSKEKFDVEWDPEKPKKLNKEEIGRYKAAREEALKLLDIDGNILVVEV